MAGQLMSRCLPIAAVQAEPIPVDRALDVFAASAEGVAADFPQAELLIYPELYLCGLNGRAEERDAHMVVSVNGAAPYGTGRSLIVDPEGLVRHQAGEGATVISDVLDLDAVSRVRRFGTAGLNRLWQQFGDGDQALELPLYHGRIDPGGWSPNRFDDRLGNADQTGLTLRQQDDGVAPFNIRKQPSPLVDPQPEI
jgi:hypothetical protein